jgi:hypothetical protein
VLWALGPEQKRHKSGRKFCFLPGISVNVNQCNWRCYSWRKNSSLGNSVANIALSGKQAAGNIPAQRNCIGRLVIGKASQN